MSNILCSFSGKFGDILWSLATAKEISRLHGCPVDFATMPYYESIYPLLESQSYIEKAVSAPEWLRTNSNHGDQPWEPPQQLIKGYEKCYHLTYRAHPGIGGIALPLIDFIAHQQGIRFAKSPIPFIEVQNITEENPVWGIFQYCHIVAYSFNEQYAEQKQQFFLALQEQMKDDVSIFFADVSKMSWIEAAWAIKHSLVFVGCRSACQVLCQGVGQQSITFEPHPARHASGHLGGIFGCPYGREFPLPFNMPVVEATKAAAVMIGQLVSEAKEIHEACVKAGADK